jgi:uncharacterized RDD family membrane protein YckC
VTGYTPIWNEDRRTLDSRRVGAWMVDNVLLAMLLIPLTVLFGELNAGAWLTYLALVLTYFFVCETRTGQTVGKALFDLRVVSRADAGPVPATAIAGRTVLRLIEPGLIGLVVMLVTGRRRQRLGDLAAGSAVTRASARPFSPPRRSPLISIYPATWIGAAAAVILMTGHGGDAALAQIDQACVTENNAMGVMTPDELRVNYWKVRIATLNSVASARFPTDKARRAASRLVQLRNEEISLARSFAQPPTAGQSQVMQDLLDRHSDELRGLGLTHC